MIDWSLGLRVGHGPQILCGCGLTARVGAVPRLFFRHSCLYQVDHHTHTTRLRPINPCKKSGRATGSSRRAESHAQHLSAITMNPGALCLIRSLGLRPFQTYRRLRVHIPPQSSNTKGPEGGRSSRREGFFFGSWCPPMLHITGARAAGLVWGDRPSTHGPSPGSTSTPIFSSHLASSTTIAV